MTNKLSDKDKKDWEKFINSKDKLENKDKNDKEIKKNFYKKTIDLHGYTLENANKKIKDFIEKSYLEGVTEINVITGKGSRSKNINDPYQSTDLGILKYSIPDYIKNNEDLIKKIKKIDYGSINNTNQGNFSIILKKK